MSLDWDNLPEKMQLSDDWKLKFYKEDGTEAKYDLKEDGVTHELEYINAEEIQPKNPKYFDPAKGPLIEFTFKDLTLDAEVKMPRQVKTRFFKAFTALKPKIGEKMKIKRTGHSFDTEYQVARIT